MRVKKIAKFNSLAARWVHPEREGIVTGHGGFAPMSALCWAGAVDKPFGRTRPAELGCSNDRLPEVKMPKHISRKVTSLAACAAFHAEKRERIALRVDCVPCATDFDEKGHAEKAVAETLRIGNFFARLYSGKVALQGEPKDFGSVSDAEQTGGSHVPKLVWARE